jgi:DNA phosphorothioation system restriction enzyme
MDNSQDKLNNKNIDWQKITETYCQKYNYYQLNKYKLKEGKSFYFSLPLGIGIPNLPHGLKLRDYQHEAVLNWFKNKGRGTLKMATGSGKTITALAITTELYQQIKLKLLLVICPYCHLVNQWAKECEKFNLSPILAFENVNNWQGFLANQLYNIRSETQSFVTIITTNSTFINDGFQSLIKFFPEKSLIVGDEVHHLGSPRLESCLPRNIGLRLALSATPDRYFDEEGTDLIYNYFGNILQPEFTLKDAIEKGALSEYLYYPIFVNLTESESFLYAKLTKRIGWALSQNNNFNKNETLTTLLMKRSRLIGVAENKLNALRELMVKYALKSHTLFYCGDGNVDNYNQNYGRQVEAVTRILGTELGYRVNTYTAQTSLEEREAIKKQFETGELQGIVAIKCLDEGVDIPIIKNAVILASSSNPRQFIQRRGRILRPHSQKEKAKLFDMIVLPPNLDRETWEVEKTLLKKELNRFIEFAQLASNSTEAIEQLSHISNQFLL